MPLSTGYAKEIERNSVAAVRDLQDVLAALDARIAKIVATLDTKDGALVKGQARNASRVRGQVIEAIKKLGAAPITSSTQEAAAEAAAKIGERAIKDLSDNLADGFEFDARIEREIGQIVGGYTKEIAAQFGDLGRSLSSEINAAIAGAKDLDRLQSKLSDKTAGALSRAMTLVDTAVSAAQRQAIVRVASEATDENDEPLFVFEYTGPSDDLTRPFCDKHLGRYLSQEYIDKTRNDQGLPMSSTCGGYNCRHSLAPTPIELVPEGETIL